MKEGYYSDGVTKFSDPFYKCVCRNCLHRYWSVTIASKCPVCKSDDIFQSFDAGEADAEAVRLGSRDVY